MPAELATNNKAFVTCCHSQLASVMGLALLQPYRSLLLFMICIQSQLFYPVA